MSDVVEFTMSPKVVGKFCKSSLSDGFFITSHSGIWEKSVDTTVTKSQDGDEVAAAAAAVALVSVLTALLTFEMARACDPHNTERGIKQLESLISD